MAEADALRPWLSTEDPGPLSEHWLYSGLAGDVASVMAGPAEAATQACLQLSGSVPASQDLPESI